MMRGPIESWRNQRRDYHRVGGPSFRDHSRKGLRQEYRQHGKLHRTDGPAIQTSYTSGRPYWAEYRIDGKLHREDGPAMMHWYDSGDVSPYNNGEASPHNRFFLKGVEYFE